HCQPNAIQSVEIVCNMLTSLVNLALKSSALNAVSLEIPGKVHALAGFQEAIIVEDLALFLLQEGVDPRPCLLHAGYRSWRRNTANPRRLAPAVGIDIFAEDTR